MGRDRKDDITDITIPTSPQYKVEPRCSICTSVSKSGKMLRDEADAMLAKGLSYNTVVRWLAEHGVIVKQLSLIGHVKKHSPYVRKAKAIKTRSALSLQNKIESEFRTASQALQRIISTGDQMVENWIEGGEGPQMPVTERLYIEAIREQGKREKAVAVDRMIDEMDKLWVEGEIVTPKVLPEPSGRNEALKVKNQDDKAVNAVPTQDI